jgi:hypothetical protein
VPERGIEVSTTLLGANVYQTTVLPYPRLRLIFAYICHF